MKYKKGLLIRVKKKSYYFFMDALLLCLLLSSIIIMVIMALLYLTQQATREPVVVENKKMVKRVPKLIFNQRSKQSLLLKYACLLRVTSVLLYCNLANKGIYGCAFSRAR